MANEKRLIDANAFRNLLEQVVYDVFTVHEHDGKLTGTASVGYYTETIEEVLKQTPTVDAVEVVHGRWEDVALRYTQVKEKCSICGGIVYAHGFNYCPNCGAKMDGDGMREKLIELIRNADKEDYTSRTQDEHYSFMADFLIANDVVQVVRCKDCRKPRKFSDGSLYCLFTQLGVNHEDFCSYGERKDNVH